MSETESSKQAAKRLRKERLAIRAAFVKNKNAGVRVKERDHHKTDSSDKDWSNADEINSSSDSDDSGFNLQMLTSNKRKKETKLKKKVSSKHENKQKRKRFLPHNSSDSDSGEGYSSYGGSSDGDPSNNNSSKQEYIRRSSSHGSRDKSSMNSSHKGQKDSTYLARLSSRNAHDPDKNNGEESNPNSPIDPSSNESMSKKTRGPTQPKAVLDTFSKKKIKFNDKGQAIGKASVLLSTECGSIAKDMVPLTYDDWRHIPKPQKELIWEFVKQKYILDEELGKNYTLQLIGKLWRAHKSRLRKSIRDCENKEDIKALKPGGVEENEWETFVRKMSYKDFKKKRKKFKEMRALQDLPHTCSRQGYARLEEQMKKESPDPSLITRTRVWLRGHTKKNGEPANANVAEKMKKIRDFEDSTPNSSQRSIRNDALSQVIGPDRNGRLRGVGHGVTASKLGESSRNLAIVTQFHEEMAEMKGQVTQLTDLVTSQKKLIDTLLTKLQSQCEGNVELRQLDRPIASNYRQNISYPQKGGRSKHLDTSLATTSDAE